MLEPNGVVLVLRSLEAKAHQVILTLVEDRQPQVVVATLMIPTSWDWARPRRIVRAQ